MKSELLDLHYILYYKQPSCKVRWGGQDIYYIITYILAGHPLLHVHLQYHPLTIDLVRSIPIHVDSSLVLEHGADQLTRI